MPFTEETCQLQVTSVGYAKELCKNHTKFGLTEVCKIILYHAMFQFRKMNYFEKDNSQIIYVEKEDLS